MAAVSEIHRRGARPHCCTSLEELASLRGNWDESGKGYMRAFIWAANIGERDVDLLNT